MNFDKRITDLLSLEGKVAMVTGAASGIGLGTAIRLAEVGANIVLLDIDESKGIEAADKIRNIGQKAEFFRCDVTSNHDCKKTTESAVKEFVVDFNAARVPVKDINKSLRKHAIFGGKDLSGDFPELGNCALYCVTEIHTKKEIDRLVQVLSDLLERTEI
ncbi:MAG: SDR family NAD(P)-dependent oxidoreductase [Candidatus Aminicenantes bacterium]|nr:SDR family NAD(P)-dependent oxidoreductase [Candidatus Aminicenantes bacterium]